MSMPMPPPISPSGPPPFTPFNDVAAPIALNYVIATPVPTPLPLAESDRLPAMDVLRGIAILGILLLNIASFAMPSAAYIDPYAYGEMEGANLAVYVATHLFAFGKFITIFAMLFGAGIAMQFARGLRIAAHLRRMAWLALIGLLHAYLLWYGDILFSYAILGMALFALHGLRPRWLIGVGAGLYLLNILAMLLFAAMFLLVPASERVLSDAGDIADELAVFRSGWLDQFGERAMLSVISQTFYLLIFTGPCAGGMMLIGMALAKLGFFAAAWKRSSYAMTAIIGCATGWTLSWLSIHFDSGVADGGYMRGMVWSNFNTLGMPFVAIGYASAVVWLVGRREIRVLWPLAAIGRTALSCYLLTTVICTTLFYGHGFGWFGYLDRVQQLYVVFCVWAVLLVVAPVWLMFFKQGPMEWLWRRATYWGSTSDRTANGVR